MITVVLLLSVVMLGISIDRNRWTQGVAGGFVVLAMEEGEESDYVMPYPGVLPDSPLYIVKMVRDWLREVLSVAPEDKVELFNQYADKRVGAMEALMRGGKFELAVETGEKGAMYQERAIGALEAVKARGGDVGKGGNVLERAILKHVEIARKLSEENESVDLSGLIGSMEKHYDEVKKVLGR